MSRHFAAALTLLICSTTFAEAATMSCLFAKEDTIVDESCQLDTAGTTECQYAYTTETPNLVGFCYAYPQDATGSTILAGCGFATAEANIAAMSDRLRTGSPNRAQPAALEPGFFAIGDTVGVPDDVFVGFVQGVDGPSFVTYCQSAGK
jgi:hypothetical protein